MLSKWTHEIISKLAKGQSYYISCKFNYDYMEESFSQPKKLCFYWTLLNCIKRQNEFRVGKYIRDHLVQWFLKCFELHNDRNPKQKISTDIPR